MNITVNEPPRLAGRGRRLLAWCIDAVLVPALTILLVMMTGIVEDAGDYASNWWMFWVLLLAVASYLLLNGRGLVQQGQTLGKRLLGIALVSSLPADRFAVPVWWRLILVRAWFFPVSFLVLIPPLLLLPLFDHLLIFSRRRRCLHDLVAGTIVVDKRHTGGNVEQTAGE